MSNTFSRIYLQFVFAVQGRQSLIPKQHKEELHKYMTGLVQKRKAKMLAVHCMPDHTHLFVGFKPSVLISDFVKEIKIQSNEFIKEKKWINGDSVGRKVTVCFHTGIPRLIVFANTF